MKKKVKRSNGLEVIRDGELDKYVDEALKAFEEGRPPSHPDPEEPGVTRPPLPTVEPTNKPDAVVVHFGVNDSMLAVRWSSRRSPLTEQNWLPVCRYQPQRLGSYEAIVSRRFVAPLTASAVASLEAAIGNNYEMAEADLPAEQTELEGAVIVTNNRNLMWRLWVRHRGLWHAVGLPISRTNKYAPTTEEKARQRRRELGYAPQAIV